MLNLGRQDQVNNRTRYGPARPESKIIFQEQQIICTWSAYFISQQSGLEWPGGYVSTSAFVLKGDIRMVCIMERKHMSDNSAKGIVETQLFGTS